MRSASRTSPRWWRLLRLLALTPRATVAVVAIGTVMAAAPIVEALTVGWFFRTVVRSTRAGAGLGPLRLSLPALAITLVLSTAGLTLDQAVRRAAVRGIDGAVRDQLRRAALSPDRLDHLLDPRFRDDLADAGALGASLDGQRTLGAAAVGQAAVAFRILSALLAAAIWATLSPALAVTLLAVALLTRALLYRQWVPLAAERDDPRGQRHRDAWSDLAVNPAAAKEVRIFGLENWITGRYRRYAVRASAGRWRRLGTALRGQWWILALTAVGMAIPLGVTGYWALDGRLPVDRLVTYLVATQGLLAISALGQEAFDIEYGGARLAAYRRLRATLPADVPPGQHRATAGPASGRPAPAVRFDDVSFRYPRAAAPALNGLSLSIRSGDVLAVVGLNGAGKTTLTRLLAGLYRPSAGRITVDGADLASTNVAEWRCRLAVMGQEFIRYPASLADNVALLAPEHLDDIDGVLRALSEAGADDLVRSLPDGVATMLWHSRGGGTELSGGQWQRIALARLYFAFAHGRRLLILDEPTSHLDVLAEAEFFDQLVARTRGATVIIISHRLATIRSADRIVVLGNGRVVEQGHHDDLMAAGGAYARLFQLQASRFVDAADQRS